MVNRYKLKCQLTPILDNHTPSKSWPTFTNALSILSNTGRTIHTWSILSSHTGHLPMTSHQFSFNTSLTLIDAVQCLQGIALCSSTPEEWHEDLVATLEKDMPYPSLTPKEEQFPVRKQRWGDFCLETAEWATITSTTMMNILLNDRHGSQLL